MLHPKDLLLSQPLYFWLTIAYMAVITGALFFLAQTGDLRWFAAIVGLIGAYAGFIYFKFIRERNK